MGAKTPEQIDELMLLAYESRDAEAIADLYEDDAIFSNPPSGRGSDGNWRYVIDHSSTL